MTRVKSGRTTYVVTDANGNALDKDGYDPVSLKALSLENVDDYLYLDKDKAEAYVGRADPEGKSGLSVRSLHTSLEILL